MQHADPAQFMAGPHASSADHALVRLMQEERIGCVYRYQFGSHLEADGIADKVLFQGLQFTVEVFVAGAAVSRMAGQDQFHGHAPRGIDLIGFGHDRHPGGYRCRTGGKQPFRAVDFDNAQAACADGGQIGMVAQVRNIDAGIQCGLENAFAFLRFNFLAIDGKL